jgi:large subunit ribosomal protein L4e
MKTKTYPNKKEINLPSYFEGTVREDLIYKAYLATIKKQPYGVYPLAGKQSSMGKQRHARRAWKTLYGKGISRVPRKYLVKRGEQMYMVGTYIPGTVKGRAAHPPKAIRLERKINKKEKILALKSAIAATASKEYVSKKYSKRKITNNLPLILESDMFSKKPKEIVKILKEILGFEVEKKFKVRAGKGKMRGRKYKKGWTLLLVTGNKENKKLGNFGVETINASNLSVKHLANGGIPGRLTAYTEQAIQDLDKRINKEKEK